MNHTRMIKPITFLLIMVSLSGHAQKLADTGESLDIRANGQTLLSYVYSETMPPDTVDPVYKRSAYIHPLRSPGGEILTRIQPPDHYHHYGIWNPWTHTRIDGEQIDFWNLALKQGTVRFAEFLDQTEEADKAGFVARHEHVRFREDGTEQVAIDETWDVKVHRITGDSYILDLTTTLNTPLEGGILLEQYRYGGGLGFRATEKWGSGNSTVLTSEGKTRLDADGTGARWVIIEGESRVPEGRSGVLFLSHPENRAHPEPMRMWPPESQDGTGNVFFEFTPIRHQEWRLQQGKNYVLRYRMVVFDGEMEVQEAGRHWDEFAGVQVNEPAGPHSRRPNVLLIISDDLNTRIGPYMEIGDHTPHLDMLAEQGIRFTRAFCQYPICGPSRASLMSGLYPETNGVLRNNDQPGSYRKENPDLAGHPSLAGFFREQGYYTARVSKIYHMGVPGGIERGDPGGDDPDSWDYAYNVMGPETLSDGTLELLSPKNLHYGGNFSRMILDDGLEHTQADFLAVSQAIAIMENRSGKLPEGGTNKRRLKPDAPFFLGVGLVRPHVPFVAPESCYLPYPDQEMEVPDTTVSEEVPPPALARRNQKVWGMDELQKKKTISGYMASVRFMDRQVGRLMEALDRLGIREETIVVFLSDHGYNLGEHDCWSKVSLWEGSVRVPMIISDPGNTRPHGSSNDQITELIDLYPTLTELCGLAHRQPDILQGESLAGIVRQGTTQRKKKIAYTTTSQGKASTIRTERWRYTRWGEEAGPEMEELYDHLADPGEKVNLAGRSDFSDVLEQLRGVYVRIRSEARGDWSDGQL